jgi:hypothetical protein
MVTEFYVLQSSLGKIEVGQPQVDVRDRRCIEERTRVPDLSVYIMFSIYLFSYGIHRRIV